MRLGSDGGLISNDGSLLRSLLVNVLVVLVNSVLVIREMFLLTCLVGRVSILLMMRRVSLLFSTVLNMLVLLSLIVRIVGSASGLIERSRRI